MSEENNFAVGFGIGTEALGSLHTEVEKAINSNEGGTHDSYKSFDEKVEDIGLEIIHGLVTVGFKVLARMLKV